MLFFAAQSVHAAKSGDDFAFDQSERFPTSAADLFSEISALNCSAKCAGESDVCSEQTDMNSCLSKSSANGCFWSCD